MTELQEARAVAIGLGGTITDNSVGFIACFSDEPIAQHYLTLVEDYESLAAEKQDKCVVTIIAASAASKLKIRIDSVSHKSLIISSDKVQARCKRLSSIPNLSLDGPLV
ncbi:hypothetical protein [Leptothoe sp. PORK10 BA2]|uniref:hypothetical protein n=1 Tax=Leptothoe sp. PORK10 BA2 TaxID=3110254 RepID=UPI002B1FC073|nr:hypothetical protein [Leptothoe sp. PORK10 BA2]MEA5465792.1 hypothetical protein [Leptothoe sp. PORK10 BA2]